MITLRLESKTRKTETWLTSWGLTLCRVTVPIRTGERALDRQREALVKSFGEKQYRMIGNRREWFGWVTEWTTL